MSTLIKTDTLERASLHPSVIVVVGLVSLCLVGVQDPVAASGDFVHPDGVEDIQADAGQDPGRLSAQAEPVERRSAERGHHP